MVNQVSDQMAGRIAVSISPDALQYALNIPSEGEYVVYGGRRYLLTIRNNKYVAWDISVFDADGDLLTDSFDVFLSNLADLPLSLIEGTIAAPPKVIDAVGTVAAQIPGAVDKYGLYILAGLALVALIVIKVK